MIQEEYNRFCTAICYYGWHKSSIALQTANSSWSNPRKFDRICRKHRGYCVLRCQKDPVKWSPWTRQQLHIAFAFLTSSMLIFGKKIRTWRRNKSAFMRTIRMLTKLCLEWENWEIWGPICLDSHCSPNLSPLDFQLFSQAKKFVYGKHFASYWLKFFFFFYWLTQSFIVRSRNFHLTLVHFQNSTKNLFPYKCVHQSLRLG